MKHNTTRIFVHLLLAGLLMAGLWGCAADEPDTLGEQIDDAADKLGDAADEAADEVQDAAEEAGEAVQDAAEEAKDAVDGN